MIPEVSAGFNSNSFFRGVIELGHQLQVRLQAELISIVIARRTGALRSTRVRSSSWIR